uniref:Uncharacterized protein n=1 Tax=Aegilops tauschii subsp. strangulata TaxID=200361 RepID=A0A453TBZ1_AEGTS
ARPAPAPPFSRAARRSVPARFASFLCVCFGSVSLGRGASPAGSGRRGGCFFGRSRREPLLPSPPAPSAGGGPCRLPRSISVTRRPRFGTPGDGSWLPWRSRRKGMPWIHLGCRSAQGYRWMLQWSPMRRGWVSILSRKPYTITKQREKWTEEEHEKFLEALKLYGRSWRQIQEHIGTKTAVQIRSHAQKFFSKVVREPGAKIEIEIPPPRPKRKPLHPYPRKRANSCNGANAANGQSKLAHMSSSSGSDQENGSPVSVISAMQSDAFGSSMSNPSSRSASPESSDEENIVLPMVNGGEGQQTGIDQSHKEADQENKDTGTSEEDSSDEVQ